MAQRRSGDLKRSTYRDYDDFFPHMSLEDNGRFFHHYVPEDCEPLKMILKVYENDSTDDPDIKNLLLAKKEEPAFQKIADNSIDYQQDSEPEKESLLEVPVSRLKREILQEIVENKPAEDQTLSEQLAATSLVANAERNQNQNQKLLWTDRYMPKNFFELLSDDQTNKEVLTWLKAWDPIVFPSEHKVIYISIHF